jgi:Bacterial membrane protein YfhO
VKGRALVLPAACLGGLVALFFWRAAFLQGVFFLSDVSHTYYPRFLFTASALREGRLPLWNPFLALGQPHLGDPAATALYPPAVAAFLLLPGFAAYNYLVLGHVFLAGIGTVVLARALGLSTWAATLAGIVYALGGWTLTHIEHINVLVGACWLPLLLWLVERALSESARRALLTGAVAVATYLLGAHTQMALYAASAVALYAALRMVGRPRRDGSWRRPAGAAAVLVAAGILGAGLAAIQLLPMAESIRRSSRGGGLGEDVAFAYSFPPEQLLGLVAPYAFEGRLDASAPWGRSNFREMTLYVGLVPLLLAIFGAASARRDGRAAAFLILLGTSLVMALGSYSPLSPVLAALPLFNLVRFPTRVLFVAALSLALLAGLGLDALRSRPEGTWARRLVWIGGAGLVSLVALNLLFLWPATSLSLVTDLLARVHPNAEDPPEWYLETARFVFGLDQAPGRGLFISLLLGTGLVTARLAGWIRGAGGLALVLGASTVDLLLFSQNPTRAATTAPSFFEEPSPTVDIIRAEPQLARAYYFGLRAGEEHYRRIVRPMRLGRVANYKMLLTEGLRGSFGSIHGIATLEGTGLTSARQFEVLRALGGYQPYDLAGRELERSELHVGLLGLLNGRYVTTLGKLNDPRLRLLRQGPIVGLYRNDVALPRAFVAHRFEVVGHPEEIVARLTSPDSDPGGPVFLEQDPGFLPLPNSSGEAMITRYAPEEVTVVARLVGPGLLVLSDAFDPDWKAEVDGSPAPILCADAVLRGVALPGGRHEVRFRYAPPAVARGGVLSLVSLGLVAGAYFSKRGSSIRSPGTR